ncbi:MAG: zinc ribbon domain-containing protein [Advenella sp.]|nr:zinc ribbon domain-containing protein [Advenella sp.]
MPIYAYKCSACGHEQDVLQKMSDDPLTVCPECKQETYTKQVTAAGFQLKGTGWYVTDFRGSNPSSGGAAASSGASSAPGGSTAPTSGSSTTSA